MRVAEIARGTSVVARDGSEGVFSGVGRIAGRQVAYVKWPDGRTTEHTLRDFKERFTLGHVGREAEGHRRQAEAMRAWADEFERQGDHERARSFREKAARHEALGGVKKNALLSRPPERYHRLQDTSWFRRAMGRPPKESDYDGIHTTTDVAIAGAYAMSAWEQAGGENDDTHLADLAERKSILS